MKTLLTSAAALLLAVPAFAQDGTDISMDEVPEAARAAAESNANGVAFDAVQLDPDSDTDTYEFQGVKDDGMSYEVDVLADGTIEEIEEEVSMETVPQAVSATLDEQAAGFEPSLIEKSTRDDGATIIYEIEGMLDGQQLDIEVNEDGSGFTSTEMEG